MRIEKRILRNLFANWIKHDSDLWGALQKIQIKLLYDRIVREKTYLQMATEHKATINQIRTIIKVILKKIKIIHGQEMYDLLELINEYLEDVELGLIKPNDPIKKVCLN